MATRKPSRPAVSRDKVARFTVTIATDWRRRTVIPVPFDPDRTWGPKEKHHGGGTVNGCGLRAVIERIGDGYGISVGPAWRRDRGFEPGMKVDVALLPEGPQRGDLAADVGSALEASPKAGALRCLELIDHVKEARAEHIVTRHGRPVARLGPAGKVASASALGVMQGTLLRYDQPYEPIPAVWSIDRDE